MAKSFRDVRGNEIAFTQGTVACWFGFASGIIQLDRNGACDLRDLLDEFILPEDENFALTDAPAVTAAPVTPMPVRVLARLSNVDVLMANDFLRFAGEFCTGSGTYSLGLRAEVGTPLIRGLFGVFGAEQLSEIEGKPCWLTLKDYHRIVLIEPLFPSDGTPFDVARWETEAAR